MKKNNNPFLAAWNAAINEALDNIDRLDAKQIEDLDKALKEGHSRRTARRYNA